MSCGFGYLCEGYSIDGDRMRSEYRIVLEIGRKLFNSLLGCGAKDSAMRCEVY